jgi:hypothetical protein
VVGTFECENKPSGSVKCGEFLDLMGLQEIEWKLDWINLAKVMDRWRDLVNAVMNLRVP